MDFRVSNHAREELNRRGILFSELEAVLKNPQQVSSAIGGRTVYQSQFSRDDGQPYLIRAIVENTPDQPVVVTVYRTSKIKKYWKSS